VRSPRLNSAAVLSGLVVVIVAAAALVWHNLPTPTDLYGPFDVRGTAGEPVRGHSVVATVDSLRIGAQVNSIQAAGDWVVVDTVLEATDSTALPRAELVVGPNSYTPSDRFFMETLGAEIAPGITQRGSWVFDVASPLVADAASEPITLRVWTGSDLLASRLVIEVPADDPRIARTGDIDLTPPEVSAR
jgi:hypothetical protein